LNAKRLPRYWSGFAKASAFVVVFLSALPTYQQWFKSLQINVPFSKVAETENQNKMWQDNETCYKHATPIQVTTSSNDALSVTVCPGTGDLLLDIQPPGKQQQITRWIGLHDLEVTSSAGLFPAAALAAEAPFEIAQTPAAVLCQKWIGPGIVLRRVRYANGQCFDQQINTYSGLVMSVAPAPCLPSC